MRVWQSELRPEPRHPGGFKSIRGAIEVRDDLAVVHKRLLAVAGLLFILLGGDERHLQIRSKSYANSMKNQQRGICDASLQLRYISPIDLGRQS
jgi:hypothetical protein